MKPDEEEQSWIGNPVKVKKFICKNDPTHFNPNIEETWMPATITAIKYGEWVVVAYANHQMEHLEWTAAWSLT